MRLALLFWRVGAMNELQYRANLVVQLVQSVLATGTALLVLALVYARTDELDGWERSELLVVLGVFTLMGGVIRAVIQPNMQRLIEDVRLGTFDYLLTRPEDSQLLASVREIRIWQGVDVGVGLVVVGAGLAGVDEPVGLADVAAFVVLLVLGTVMIYCFWLILTTSAFWFVRMDQVQELFDGVYRAGQYPVTIYPGWLRAGLTFVVPLGFAITVPSEAATSRLEGGTVVLALGVAVGLVVVSRVFWRFGTKHYAGASA